MNKRENSKLMMSESVALFLKKKPEILAQDPELTAYTNSLDAVNKTIRGLTVTQSATTKGATAVKNLKAEALIKSILDVSGALTSLATRTKDQKLLATVRVNTSAPEHMTDHELLTLGRTIADAAAPYATQLERFQITALDVENLTANADAFELALPEGRTIEVTTVGATAFIKENLAKASKLLKEDIDNAMLAYRKTNPEFYTQYKSARRILDSASGHTAKPEEK